MITKNQKRRQRLLNTSADVSSTDAATTTTTNQLITSDTLPIEKIIEKGDHMWKAFKEYIKANPKFVELADKQKLEFFRTKMGYEIFMNEFPIVSRYIICMGQYRSKAFKRMLEKMRCVVHPPPEKREKGYMEDQWVRRQADYVQYLWEEYQKGHYNTSERNFIWQESYKRLKGEFDDFRNLHKDMEKKIEEEKKTLAGQNVRDLLERLRTGAQKINPQEEAFLREHLAQAMIRNKFNSVMRQLKTSRPETEHSKQSMGTNEAGEQPKITMIETVDVERMNEIPDKYRPDELKGLEPILE